MSLMNSKSMEGKTPAEQASQALLHILRQIRDHGEIGWYMGLGSQSFALATEAYATLNGGDVAEIRDYFRPVNPRNPYAEDES